LYAVLAAGRVGLGYDAVPVSGPGHLHPPVSGAGGIHREHPSDGAARFVLAYHYLVTKQADAAVSQLKEVVKLTPGNTLRRT